MFTVQYYVTHETKKQAQKNFAALAQLFANSKYSVTYNKQGHSVIVTRKCKKRSNAIKHFNATVQLFCNTVAQHTCTEQHVPGCYVIDNEGYAAY